LEQEIVREFDVRLVDFVDEQDGPLLRDESLPQFPSPDVVLDVGDARVPELTVAQTRNRVVFVKPLQRLGGGFDMPLDQGRAYRLRDFSREHGLAGARLALDEQRTL